MPAGMTTLKGFTTLLALALACTAFTVHADDASNGVPLPALRSSPTGALRTAQAALEIAGRHVHVELSLVSDGAMTPATVSWQSERFGWMGYGETYPDRQFPELVFHLDGLPASMTTRDEVWHGADDITFLVVEAGLDPFSMTETPPFVVPRAGPSQSADASAAAVAHAQLIRRGAIETAKEGEIAKWTARRHQQFLVAAADAHRLQVAYDARPGIEPASRTVLARPEIAKRYCLAAAAIPKAVASGGWVIGRYNLPAGIDGKTSGRVTLAITGDARGKVERWFVCGRGGHPVVSSGELPATEVQTDARGAVHVLRLSLAAPD